MSRLTAPRDDVAHTHVQLSRERHCALKKAAADEGCSMNQIISRFIDAEILPRYKTRRSEKKTDRLLNGRH